MFMVRGGVFEWKSSSFVSNFSCKIAVFCVLKDKMFTFLVLLCCNSLVTG